MDTFRFNLPPMLSYGIRRYDQITCMNFTKAGLVVFRRSSEPEWLISHWHPSSSILSIRGYVLRYATLYTLLDSISDSYFPERFIGVKSRLCFESTAWSPLNVSDHGNSLLAISVSSDRSVHFKILDFSSLYGGVSHKFEEIYSLTEILRQYWFVIHAYTVEGDRRMLSDIFPSLSLLMMKYNPRAFVTWVDKKLRGCGLVIIAFGTCVFMFALDRSDCTPLCCILACDDTDSIDDISAKLTDDSTVSVTVSSVRHPVKVWDISLVAGSMGNETRLLVSTCKLRNADTATIVRYKQPDPVVLSRCHSSNHVYLFSSIRTKKGIQIRAQPSEVAPITVDETLTLLAQTLLGSPDSAVVIDIAKRLLILCDPNRVNLGIESIAAGEDVLDTILRRITQSELIVAEFSSLDKRMHHRIAFGLYHMCCQFDPVARSGNSLRLNDRAEILASINGHNFTEETVCSECGSSGTVAFLGYKLYSVCDRGGHKVPLCMKNMEPIQIGEDLNHSGVSECCWCCSLYKTETTSVFGICEICRIGLVSPV